MQVRDNATYQVLKGILDIVAPLSGEGVFAELHKPNIFTEDQFITKLTPQLVLEDFSGLTREKARVTARTTNLDISFNRDAVGAFDDAAKGNSRILLSDNGQIAFGNSPAGGAFTNWETLGVTGDHSINTINLYGGLIKFPVIQSASTDPNTLDDYEEGNWTPVIGGAGGTSGQTYGVQAGEYVKFGQGIIARFRCDLTLKGTITGAVQIQGLPFTNNAIINAISQNTLLWANTAGNWVNLQTQLTQTTGTTAPIFGIPAAAAAFNALVTADIANNTILVGNIVYRTAA